jgi:hypothetical protein
MVDVLDGTGENGAFGLFARAVRDDATQFIYTVIDIAATSTFNFFLYDRLAR